MQRFTQLSDVVRRAIDSHHTIDEGVVVMPMSKQELIEAIQQHNRTALPEFLWRFEEQELDRYLRRLTLVHNHRGPMSVWRRETICPAITAWRKHQPAA